MSQSGYTAILIYASGTASNVPLAANLSNGSSGAELAINYADGKLFYKDSSGVIQTLATKATGTIGGSTTQVQYNLSGALAGSANLTFNGTTLTAAGLAGPFNGTVGATTPSTGAFTTLSASSTVTFNQSNANTSLAPTGTGTVTINPATAGTINNMSIGATTAASGKFSALTNTALTSGRVVYSTTAGLETDSANLTFDGTTLTANALTTTSTVTINGGTANGVAYLNASKVLTTGSALTFDGTNLGVGTSSPSTYGSLAVVKNATGVTTIGVSNTNAATNDGAKLATFYGATEVTSLKHYWDGGAFQGQLYSYGSLSFLLGSSPAEQMRLTSTGLGIGTSSPAYKLDVVGGQRINAVSGGYLDLSYNGTVVGNILAANALFYVNTQTTNTTINANGGNVGIGLTAPTSKLHVQGAVGGLAAIFSDATNYTLAIARSGATGSVGMLYGTTGSSLALGANGSEAARIDTSGNLGLGVTPSAWGLASSKAMDFTGGGAVAGYNNGSYVVANAYNNGSNWIYKATAAAGFYTCNAGLHIWYNAASGTAGNTITFTQAMTLDNAGTLTVGDGSILNQIQVNSSAWANHILKSPNTNGGSIYWNNGTTNKGEIFYYHLADYMSFTTNSVERARIDSSGNLGIGTSSPAGRLEASSANCIVYSTGTAGYGAFYAKASGTNTSYLFMGNATSGEQGRISCINGGELTFSNTASVTERMRLDSSGNLGLGVTPAAWSTYTAAQVQQLSLASFTNGDGRVSNNCYYDGANWKYINTRYALQYLVDAANGAHKWNIAASGTAGNAITFTTAMTLDASGNLLVGTTSTYGGPGRINVGFNQSTNFGITLRNTSATATGVFVSFENSGGTGNGSITQASSSAVLYNTTSDYRLKSITGPITNSGAYIDSLKPVEGTWKADGSTFVGLIAHEVQEASRTVVATGTKDGEAIQGMDYSSAEIIANLIAEIKSLRVRLNALENK